MSISDIKKRLSATTYGDWKVYENEDGTCIGGAEDHPQLKGPAPVVSMAYGKDGKKIYINEENAEFIVHAKQDIAWLIGYAESLERLYESQLELQGPSWQIVSDREDFGDDE